VQVAHPQPAHTASAPLPVTIGMREAPSVHAAPAVTGSMRVVTSVVTVATAAPVEFVDLTERVAQCAAAAGVTAGSVLVFSRHTTAGIRINEAEPLLLEDLTALVERLAPRNASYRHDDFTVRTVNMHEDERVNGHAHCRGLLLGASETVPIAGGELLLGRWQRIFLAEMDGPNTREVVIQVTGC
jgi:secondary thiamine-phosphate synthase enzyme